MATSLDRVAAHDPPPDVKMSTSTPTGSTTNPACCPAISNSATAAMATSCGASSTTWSVTVCSADYHLRLTADGGRMLKGQLPLTATRPTQPTVATTGTVSLRSRANNQYVSAPNGSALIANQPSAGAQPLIANRTAIGTWEKFDLVDAAPRHDLAPHGRSDGRPTTIGRGAGQGV